MRINLMNLDVPLPGLNSSEGYGFIWDYLLEHGKAGVQNEANPALTAFLAFCLQSAGESNGQMMQDLYVLYKLPKRGGFFVDFGATDGITINNTYLLEKRMSWSGIVAEPLPAWHAALQRNRGCAIDLRCVWTSTGESLEFLAPADTPELSTLNSFRDADHHNTARAKNASIFQVKTVSLNDLLLANECPKYFDYLSIDTEGSELAILRSLDVDRWKPRIITVEHNYMEEERAKLKHLLNSYGYVREFEMFSKWDDWYYHPDLLARQDPK